MHYPKLLTSGMTALLLATVFPVVGTAEPTTTTSEGPATEQALSYPIDPQLTKQEREFVENMEILSAYTDEESASFDYEKAQKESRISETQLNEYAGTLLAFGWKVNASATDSEALQNQANSVPLPTSYRGACEGSNGFVLNPPHLLLNSCVADRLSAMQEAGASTTELAAAAAALTGLELPAAALAILGGVMGLQSSLSSLCNSWGHGIKLYPGGICWSQ